MHPKTSKPANRSSWLISWTEALRRDLLENKYDSTKTCETTNCTPVLTPKPRFEGLLKTYTIWIIVCINNVCICYNDIALIFNQTFFKSWINYDFSNQIVGKGRLTMSRPDEGRVLLSSVIKFYLWRALIAINNNQRELLVRWNKEEPLHTSRASQHRPSLCFLKTCHRLTPHNRFTKVLSLLTIFYLNSLQENHRKLASRKCTH